MVDSLITAILNQAAAECAAAERAAAERAAAERAAAERAAAQRAAAERAAAERAAAERAVVERAVVERAAQAAEAAEVAEALAAVEAAEAAEAERAAQQRGASTTEAGETCVICTDAPRAVVFSCGHALCCRGCAEELQRRRQPCPVCRQPLGRLRAAAGAMHRVCTDIDKGI